MKKYFSRLCGNKRAVSMIAPKIEKDIHSHAYIIEGPKGSGKHTLAREICKALFCTGESSDTFPCEKCRFCRMTDEGISTDICVLSREDRATISVEATRGMLSTLNYAPDEGKYKVYIIDEADRMTPPAQNALLLSLEEPPSYVVFLLLCTDSAKLLETVRSRAVLIRTELFGVDFTADWLRKQDAVIKSGVGEDEIMRAAKMSGGAPGAALEYLTNSSVKKLAEAAGQLCDCLCRSSLSQRLACVSAMKYSRIEYEKLFSYTLNALRDLIAVKSGGSETLYYPDAGAAYAVCSRVKMKKLLCLYDAVDDAKRSICDMNASAPTVMFALAGTQF